MIRVTIWNEFIHEQFGQKEFDLMKKWNLDDEGRRRVAEEGEKIRTLHNGGIHITLKGIVEEMEDAKVCHIATAEMPENGLTEEVLKDTDVLIWWAHVAHEMVSDEVAFRVVRHVQQGMGFIALHSAHLCKPLRYLLGTTCTLRWRDNDFCRVWNTCPTHPIAKGIPDYFELNPEEMYGEYFDIPKPDDVIFTSWYRGGELFRGGCTWTRGFGRIFFFHAGHETFPSYFNEHVRRIIRNAVGWCAENRDLRKDEVECIAVGEVMKNE